MRDKEWAIHSALSKHVDRGGEAESGGRVGCNWGPEFVFVCLSEKGFIF